jgi:hypothetical protein
VLPDVIKGDTMHHWIMSSIRVATLAAVLTQTASAQRTGTTPRSNATAPKRATTNSPTLGWMLGGYTAAAPGVKVTGPDIDGYFDTTFGLGAGTIVGYGFNERFTGFLSIDVTKQQSGPGSRPEGSYGLRHIEIGARANLPTQRVNTLPYVMASVGRRSVGGSNLYDPEDDEDVRSSLSGLMLAAGGGVQHFFSPVFALDAGIELSYGKLGTWDDDGSKSTLAVDATKSFRVRVGVNWYPGRATKRS